MLRPTTLFRACTLVALALPASADALTFVQILALFHVATGILLTFTLLVFASGVFVYYARLGTWPSHRDNAIKVLEWAVSLLFVLVVLLALLRYFQVYTKITLIIFSVILIIVIAVVLVRTASKKEKKPPAGGRPPPK